MACKINWTKRAWKTYENNINYLLEQWTQKEISNFVELVDKKLSNLSKHPQIGNPRNTKYPNIRCTSVHKRVLLLYKHKPSKNEIDLLIFWNTWKTPKRLGAKKGLSPIS